MVKSNHPESSGNQLAPDFMSSELDKFADQAKADGLAFEYCGRHCHTLIWWDGGAFCGAVYRNGHLNRQLRAGYVHWLLDEVFDLFGH